jgi:hypothetical protein
LLGQVNTEKYRSPEDLEGLAGFLEIGGIVKTGNTDKAEGNLDGRLDWKSGKTTTFFVFKTEHEWVGGKRISNNGLLHIRNVIEISSGLYSELFGQINYDKELLINERKLIGGGLRYRLFEFENGDFTIGNSYMYESEIYNLTDEALHPDNASVSRWSNYLSIYFKVNSNVVFGGVSYYQPSFSNFSDFRILSENSLNVALTKVLSLSMNFGIRHDSKPPDGIKKTDTKTSFGIAVKF